MDKRAKLRKIITFIFAAALIVIADVFLKLIKNGKI